jgi:transcriptional regulator with XRE-family HTH domain
MIGLEKLGPEIRSLRAFHKYSQRQLAQTIGVSFVHLNRIERGHAMPSFEMLLLICDALMVKPSSLFRKIGL